jgi:membrane associated rhomboid family serine protease
MALRNEINSFFGGSTPTLNRIILINAVVFLVANIYATASNNGPLLDYVTLPANPHVFLHRPWTIITYMFLHVQLMHILFNMLWLYWMGKLFAEYMGEKRLVYTYLLGGIAGGLLFILIYGVAFPANFDLLGASAGIMAVIVAVAGLIPEYEVHLLFFGAIRLKYLALIIFLLTSVVDFSVNSGGKVSHIGGALYGLLFIWQYRKGTDISGKTGDLVSSIGNVFKSKGARKGRLTYSRGGRSVPDKQKRIDDILDKISRSGYESLSKEEKDFLFKSSKE